MKRIIEIDFIKGILIMLMVLFHFSFFVTEHEMLTGFVYAFHMSGFLIVSGYLLNVDKSLSKLLRKLLPIYAFFEIVYLVGIGLLSSVLSSSNHFELTFGNLLYSLILHPIGTYWYLHTMIIGSVSYWAINKIGGKNANILIFLALLLWSIACFVEGFMWKNAIYFLLGITLRRLEVPFNKFFKPSMLFIVPVIIIALSCKEVRRDTLSGFFVTIFVLSFLMAAYGKIPSKLRFYVSYIGRNSLSLVLFSPVYVIVAKLYCNKFSFICGEYICAILSLLVVVLLSLISVYIMDKIGLSKLLAGTKLYVPIHEI